MAKIYLPALDLEVPASIFCNYDDMGYVDSTYECAKKLDEKYGTYKALFNFEPLFPGEPIREAAGFCAYYEQKGFFGIPQLDIIIAYLKLDNPLNDIFVRAHEESHATEKLSKKARKTLDKGIKEKIGIDCARLNNQKRANLGGYYALRKRGFDLDDLVERLRTALEKDLNSIRTSRVQK